MSYIKLKSEHKDLDKYQTSDGSIHYYKKDTDIVHNPYGPAVIFRDGYYKQYVIEDELHRLDGPAIIWSNGDKQYYINDEYLTKEQFDIHPERLKYLGKEHLICLT